MSLKKKLSICFVGILIPASAFIVTRQVVERIRYTQKPIVIGSLSKENIKTFSLKYNNNKYKQIKNQFDINKIIDTINGLGNGQDAIAQSIFGGNEFQVNISYRDGSSIALSFKSAGYENNVVKNYMIYKINEDKEYVWRIMDNDITDSTDISELLGWIEHLHQGQSKSGMGDIVK
ncbi:hypothetical protein IAI10_19410 [Clostridium sp. 19966]|uniref:hypothetical protein n=1 Tax=Clostridium sp. 19966 TaxID=2768166 RepID=UPI0028DF4828|nr:hypothetical protein [Clostridium sp. 19966]MDT8718826.1 hypothetical protein [Clostridium sp. 19966]